MSRRDEFDFGQAEKEMRGAEGRAMGAHLWEGMENIFGPVRMQAQQQAVSHLEKQFPGQRIHADDDDPDPHVKASHGPWEGRYHAGPYIEVRHKATQEPVDVIHVGENRSFSHDDMKSALKEFHDDHGPEYIQAYGLDKKRRKEVDLR
ncbi:MAG TPA: hypothetical protein VFI41_04915 [Gemmatimonadales bacterium]|nr:hypothetical protein [Gemmatimonadales bacterium]